MDRIPNWFRWLIIVIATLIMCACRLPRQHGNTALPPSTAVEAALTDGRQSQTSEATEPTDHDRLTHTLRQSRRWERPADGTPDGNPATSSEPGMAPIVRRTELTTQTQTVAVADEPAPQQVAASEGKQAVEKDGPQPNDPVAAPLPNAPEPTQPPETDHAQGLVYLRVSDGRADDIRQASAENDAIRSVLVNDAVLAGDFSVHQSLVADQPVIEMDSDMSAFMDVPPGFCMTSEGFVVPQSKLIRMYPDEYICDGGDALGKVAVRSDSSLANLDPEDTVGLFRAGGEEVVVQASNRVCIYAPRFAATRKVSGPMQSESQEQAVVAERNTRAAVEERNRGTNELDQTLAAQRHLLSQPASSMRARLPGVEGIHRQALLAMDHDHAPHENLRVMQYGVHEQSEKASLQEYVARALTWTSDQAVQIVLDEQVLQTMVSQNGAETIFVLGKNEPAKLRVIKTASVADALPGEEVEFTLRFDNIGAQPMDKLTIVDNLTTRLEFIDGSDLCSVESDFSHDPNPVDSLTLQWKLREPIAAGKGGIIRFRCRVR